MTEPLDPHLIDRYLAGEATPDEIANVQAQRRADPAWAAALDALAAEFARQPTSRWNVDAAWSRIHPAIANGNAPDRRSAKDSHTPTRATPTRQWLIAAALVLAVGATMWRATMRGHGASANPTKFANEIVTPNGARNTLTLGDGSRVTLNAGSRLRWDRDFGVRTRDVYLDGRRQAVERDWEREEAADDSPTFQREPDRADERLEREDLRARVNAAVVVNWGQSRISSFERTANGV